MSANAKIQKFALVVAILALPFAMFICHLAIIIYVFAFLLEGHLGEKIKAIRQSPFLLALLLFFALHLGGVLYSQDISNAWYNIEKKLLLFFLPFAVVTSRVLTRADSKNILKLFIVSIFLATLASFVVAWRNSIQHGSVLNFDTATEQLFHQINPQASVFWMYFSYIELANGIGLHPTYFSMYLSFTLLLLLHFYLPSFPLYRFGRKVALIGLFVYLEIFILLLSSRIVILATIGIALCYGWLILSRGSDRSLARIAFSIGFSMVLLLPVNPVTRYRALQEPFIDSTYIAQAGIYSYSTGIRNSLWFLSEQAILTVNPILGAGTGDVKAVIEKLSETYAMGNIIRSFDPHNQYIYTYLGIGLPGLLVLLYLFVQPAVRALQSQSYLYLSFMTLIMCITMTESILESQQGIAFFVMINSILIFHFDLGRSSSPLPVHSR